MPNPSEQAEAVAKWMGLEKCHLWTGVNLGSAGGPAMLKGKCGHAKCYPKEYGPPRYADSLDAMREVEDEIERRGLIPEYVAELRRFWKASDDVPDFYPYFLIRATPAQRLEAAYRTIQEAALGKVMEEEKTNG